MREATSAPARPSTTRRPRSATAGLRGNATWRRASRSSTPPLPMDAACAILPWIRSRRPYRPNAAPPRRAPDPSRPAGERAHHCHGELIEIDPALDGDRLGLARIDAKALLARLRLALQF